MRQGRIFLLSAALMSLSSPLQCYNDTPKCFTEIETNFFQPAIVIQALALSQGDVDYQNRWVPINNELRRRSQDLPNIVRQRADKMSPSPLEYPFQPDIALQLFWDVSYDVFNSVMRDYMIYDQSIVRNMFNYIRSQQEPGIIRCLGLDKPKPEQVKKPIEPNKIL